MHRQMRFEQVKDTCKEITQNTTERQKYKKYIYKRDWKNVMRKSNRHPKRKYQRLEKKAEKEYLKP